MNWTVILIGTVIGSLINRIRGGFLKDYLKAGKWIAAVAFGAIVFWLSGQWIAAVAMIVAYRLGECFGWTKWLWGMTGELSQAEYNEKLAWPLDNTGNEGPHYIAKLFANEKTNYKLFCFVGMAVRGLYWWVPVCGVLWWFGLTTVPMAIGAVVVLSLLFPVVYWLGYKIRIKNHYGATAEALYGALYGAVFGFIL